MLLFFFPVVPVRSVSVLDDEESSEAEDLSTLSLLGEFSMYIHTYTCIALMEHFP